MRLRDAAEAIWRAGVDAVRADRVIRDQVRVEGDALVVCGEEIRPDRDGQVVVVGGGKAGGGMVRGLEAVFERDGTPWNVSGHVNVPDDCVAPTQFIELRGVRPAGLNEPTANAVEQTRAMLGLVGELSPRDTCVVLLSGGGSALLCAPREGITLEDKLQVTRFLSGAGASIDELNCVRRALSDIKGGGLARACRAGRLITLIISDVIGDPLETIASGPTVPSPTTTRDAAEVLKRYASGLSAVPPAVLAVLESEEEGEGRSEERERVRDRREFVLANNRMALDAAAARARELGFDVVAVDENVRWIAREVGRELALRLIELRHVARSRRRPLCLLSGGEPTVQLTRSEPAGRGGRNQELVASAIEALWEDGGEGLALLSGGTDGEDGPTDAAGGVVDEGILEEAVRLGLRPDTALSRNDSYPYLDSLGGLLRTGATHTNVMDVRVGLVRCE